MADIIHHYPINDTAQRVFETVTTPEGIAIWWTKRSSGKPVEGAEYELDFGPGYEWRAKVTKCIPNKEFELQITHAGKDWVGTRVGFHLDEKNGMTHLRFHHIGWPETNDHFYTSNFCWAMYLRILKRHIEHGEFVPYEDRLNV